MIYMIYQELLLSIFAISWISERIYFYKIHNTTNNGKSNNGLLNLNAPLANSYSAQYNPINLPENKNKESEKYSQLNDTDNQSHL